MNSKVAIASPDNLLDELQTTLAHGPSRAGSRPCGG